ncbi:tellurite resistance/C4-dicarboxylate transporter family protein [Streptomyces solicathayae]|uniref:Tellurite resistance/C4-dicarboxylate transporter family protein n=1 Tax=Streptomyces solicathayae TaxID=3081768 RepID=A0ABZ0M2F2_9ACTN|nr:tellurite resistance/C4-dicarboxylate transporter family protein [Streptomyces sp. HUAS YS2]WOX25879.1 tellurite resistance/C4-dicarboxylate transporter family protein [Streptomyces sp. HUAS YS2]
MNERVTSWWSGLPPAAGSAVMATGILSVGLHTSGHEVLSVVALCLAGALWVLLAVHFAALAVRDRGQWEARADTPSALTAVAATTVLGARLALLGWTVVATVLLVLAAAVWPLLLVAVLRHLGRRVPGAAFLVCVATQGLVVLAAVLAPHIGDWLARAGLVLFALGLLLYADALNRFDFRQVLTGAGDHWISGGAMAFSALAAAELLDSGVWVGDQRAVLRTTTLVLLGIGLASYVVLMAAEAVRPRLGYDVRRWATVFPLGMTAAATLSAADSADVAWLDTLGRVLLWIAVAAWLLTAYGLARSVRAGRERGNPGAPAVPEL